MNTKQKRYDEDFKKEAIKLVKEQGMKIVDVAKVFFPLTFSFQAFISLLVYI